MCDQKLLLLTICLKPYLTEAVVDFDASDAFEAACPAVANRLSSSCVRPLEAKGTGSTFLRINLSAKEAKHFNAPSATT